MRRPLLTFVALVLIMASIANPAEGNTRQRVATIVAYHDFNQNDVSILVESSSDFGASDTRSLSDFGTVTTVAGRVAVLHTQRADLAGITHLPFVSGIEQSWPLHVYLDQSVPDIGADIVWKEVRDAQNRSVTGLGVIIGFVDTGIDVSHPDFTFPNGTTKILYVWDQTTKGRPPSGFGYGYECYSDDIQSGRCPETDTFGHGTHVAGIAAGSGQATGNYTGVAPDASIIFVKSGYEVCNGTSWTFDSAEILDGINYIITKARQLGRRVVINLSLGGNIGGHDGSDPMEVALDQFVEAGTPVVVAAGNQEQDNDHVQGRFTKNENTTFDIAAQESTTDLAIDIWYSSQADVDATLTTPSGRTYTVPASTAGTNTSYGNVTTLGRTSNNAKEVYFEINSETPLLSSGWSVTLRARQVDSAGIWDAWVDSSSCASPGAFFLRGNGYEIDQNDTIGIPGTAHYVVTVGAYVTKTFWKGLDGQFYGSNSTDTGGIAPYSSWGPTRDGRTKPDVAAPGSLIASARSEAIASKPSDPDPFHRILAGTSMATPHVTGTIALMLQYSPDLQAVQVSKIIGETARQDAHTGLLTIGSPIWGFGKIDARTATGLFRLTIIVNGLSASASVPVHVDTSYSEVTGDSWVDLYFARGTTHMIRIDAPINADETVQYQIDSARIMTSTRANDILNHAPSTSVKPVRINETSVLAVSYVAVHAATSSNLATPPNLPLALLVLSAVAAFFVGLGIYFLRRRDHITEPEKKV